MQPLQINIQIDGDKLISPETREVRNQLVQSAEKIQTVKTAEENKLAGESVVAMRKHVKAIEEIRLAKTLPLRDATALINQFFSDYSIAPSNHIARLQKLGTAFIEAENRRVAAEEKKRKDEFEAKLKAELEAQAKAAEAATPIQQMLANRKLEAAKQATTAVIATPEPEAQRAKGQTMKQILRYEVTDIYALVKARPDLCRIEENKTAINSTCNPNLPAIPGLKLWFENVSTYTTR